LTSSTKCFGQAFGGKTLAAIENLIAFCGKPKVWAVKCLEAHLAGLQLLKLSFEIEVLEEGLTL